MSAPMLGEEWQSGLMLLPEDWDGERGKPITAAAIKTVESFSTVPCSDGGIQLEIHRDGFDIEICIEPDGRIEEVLVAAMKRK